VKCVACNADVLYPDRQDGKCNKCGHAFAFEPRKGDKLSDAAFKAAIERVSSMHSVKWAEDHLYYEIARRTRSGSRSGALVLGVLGMIVAAAAVFWLGALLLSALFWTIAVFIWPRGRVGLERSDFARMWNRWVSAHGAPSSLIVRRTQAVSKRKGKLPSDIAGYSFDRAVITDRPETVDVLLANNFHFENNCAVLCVDGYPEGIFDTVRAMLRNNPKLTVYVLHDATVKGCSLAQRLAASREWFSGSGARIVDVGLRPVHAAPFHGCWLREPLPLADNAALNRAEQSFLSRYSVELAVIPPEQTIKRLFRAITSQVPDVAGDAAETSAEVYVNSDAFSDDASASDGGGDSFG
jgi:hypothetical protein